MFVYKGLWDVSFLGAQNLGRERRDWLNIWKDVESTVAAICKFNAPPEDNEKRPLVICDATPEQTEGCRLFTLVWTSEYPFYSHTISQGPFDAGIPSASDVFSLPQM